LSNQQILSPEPEVENSIIGCDSIDAGSYVTLGVYLQLYFKSLLILTCVPNIDWNSDKKTPLFKPGGRRCPLV